MGRFLVTLLLLRSVPDMLLKVFDRFNSGTELCIAAGQREGVERTRFAAVVVRLVIYSLRGRRCKPRWPKGILEMSDLW